MTGLTYLFFDIAIVQDEDHGIHKISGAYLDVHGVTAFVHELLQQNEG